MVLARLAFADLIGNQVVERFESEDELAAGGFDPQRSKSSRQQQRREQGDECERAHSLTSIVIGLDC
jgi:hypothetical protein